MTTTAPAPTTFTTTSSLPRRRTLVLLAVAFVTVFVAALATGADNDADSSLASIESAYDQSHLAIMITSYAGMAACAVLVFLGVAVRSALRAQRPTWTADVAMLGFVVIALTIASWAVSGLAVWHAVDQGQDASVRTLNFVDTSNFLPLMMGMICAYVGGGRGRAGVRHPAAVARRRLHRGRPPGPPGSARVRAGHAVADLAGRRLGARPAARG
jgi:hypothetical protein